MNVCVCVCVMVIFTEIYSANYTYPTGGYNKNDNNETKCK